ncbi:MAG: hypothetical protein IPL99_23435 [Candidatus Competibacteraceae bacterium]|nr:hypothetical protein [Candidatus Competibacteraceae bacterium]
MDYDSVHFWLQSFKTDPLAMADLQRIVHQHGEVQGLFRLDDESIIKQVARMIAIGRVRVCGQIHGRENAAATGSPVNQQRVAEERVIRALRMMAGNFLFEGRKFQIIRASQWLKEYSDEQYEIIPHDEARRLLEKMAAAPTLSQAEKTALQEAVALIPDLRRHRGLHSGLLLLRTIPMHHISVRSEESAVTPSQLSELAKKHVRRLAREENHWVQYNVVDRVGKPIGGIPYRFQSPDGEEEKGQLADSGKIRRDGVDPGVFVLELGELTQASWLADGKAVSAPVPVKSALTLAVKTSGLDPGTAGKFEIFHLCNEEPGSGVGTASGMVGEKGLITAEFEYHPEKDVARQAELIFSCTVGKLWIKSKPIILLLPRLFAPRWPDHEAYVGDELALSVQCPGIPDGETITFDIKRLDTDGAVATVEGTAQGWSAIAQWKSVDPDPETSESELYFIAKWDDKTIRSRTLLLKDRVELVFNDTSGRALPFLRVALEYNDGTRLSATTDAQGMIRLTDPRAMTAKVSVAGVRDDDVQLVDEAQL